MKAKILFITDLHKRYKDGTSIKGQVEAGHLVVQDLIQFNKENGITHNVLCGDWYHRGFHGLAEAYSGWQEDKMLSDSVNGNVYLTIGNHFFLERDNNPEMYVIQPNDIYKPATKVVTQEKPIFKCVNNLRLGDVQIDFFHYSKSNKNYMSPRETGVIKRIGVYHDDSVVPGWVREQEGYISGIVSQSYLNSIYSDMDLAIVGHIHTDVGLIQLNLGTGKTIPVFIPGSIGITSTNISQRHEFVKLPIVEINDDNTLSVKTHKFSTHTEKMIFVEKTKRIESLPLVADKYTGELQVTNIFNLSNYLRTKGYNEISIDIVNEASRTGIDFNDIIRVIQRGMSNESNTAAASAETNAVH